MVECNLAKVEVAGPNPVSRSNYTVSGSPDKDFHFKVYTAKSLLYVNMPEYPAWKSGDEWHLYFLISEPNPYLKI